MSESGATAPLRAGVRVDENGDLVRLVDEGGFAVEIPSTALLIVRALGRPVSEIERALRESLGDDAPSEEEVAEFVAELGRLGLLHGGIDAAAARSAARREAREQERDHALRDALVFAQSRVPLYRDRFATAGVDFTRDPTDALARVPLLTRADLRASFPARLLADGESIDALVATGRYAVNSTSGTTDERVQILSDNLAGQVRSDAHHFFGLDGGSLGRGAIFTTPVCAGQVCHLGASTIEERTLGATTTLTSTQDLFGMSDAEARCIADELATVKPEVFIVHPWYAVFFVLRARALGLTITRPRVVLSTFQLLTRAHQKLLRDAFGPTFSYYSATEAGGYVIGTECAHGRMHLREDDVSLEVLPLEGRADAGTLAITSLRNRVMPLVRYTPGDVGRFAARCDCAFAHEWRTIEVLGRAKDGVIDARGAPVFPAEIDEAIGAEGPTFYRLVQTGHREGIFESWDAAERSGIEAAERVAARLGWSVRSQSVRRFPPERSLKFRTLVPKSA